MKTVCRKVQGIITIIEQIDKEADVKVQESPDAHNRDGDQNKGISIILPLEGVNTLTLNGNEGPSNGLQIQEQRTEAIKTYNVRAVHESEADAETSGLDSNTMQSEDKQSRKKKRNIMNHIQMSMIEQVLVTEPETQRKAAMLQSWVEKLSLHVCEIFTF
ncbi:hypothetical protein CTI12_AA310820 (mitochondrion) [Artemisia annua]|uniref:Nodulin homeobox homeobox-like domain-containing protein n=1 Tax=Artemisia annua TaxID=35608 RepID=A0A2U1N430_ARTAN|nr:hypothetical protein CTI12_AA310820 [Artemisia annua]